MEEGGKGDEAAAAAAIARAVACEGWEKGREREENFASPEEEGEEEDGREKGRGGAGFPFKLMSGKWREEEAACFDDAGEGPCPSLKRGIVFATGDGEEEKGDRKAFGVRAADDDPDAEGCVDVDGGTKAKRGPPPMEGGEKLRWMLAATGSKGCC